VHATPGHAGHAAVARSTTAVAAGRATFTAGGLVDIGSVAAATVGINAGDILDIAGIRACRAGARRAAGAANALDIASAARAGRPIRHSFAGGLAMARCTALALVVARRLLLIFVLCHC
jgi:hypothetical protein